MNFEILEIRPTKNGGDVRAYFDVRYGDLIIRNFRIVQHPGKAAWISVPVTTTRQSNGRYRYTEMLSLSPVQRQNLLIMVLARWAKENMNEAHDQ